MKKEEPNEIKNWYYTWYECKNCGHQWKGVGPSRRRKRYITCPKCHRKVNFKTSKKLKN